jgi:alkanesulfonate monooxygenase SsuD/methylene tetrahydromethanopterin reductase-like flavin-dependent oxidoreductase (luciferase family)
LDKPRPVQTRIPFTFGGGNSELLRWAGAHADVVALSGLGRTLADGHSHTPRLSPAEIDRQVSLIASGAEGRSAPPAREALVQRLEITSDAEGAAEQWGKLIESSAADVLASPYALFGTEAEILARLAEHARRWGITRYVVREPALDAAESLLRRLRE